MTDIFEVIGPLFRKLTEACIAHQTAETGSATLLVESDKYMARYRFTLEPRVTENVLMKYMIFGCFEEFGRDEGLRRLRDILLTCFTDDGDINEMGLLRSRGSVLTSKARFGASQSIWNRGSSSPLLTCWALKSERQAAVSTAAPLLKCRARMPNPPWPPCWLTGFW